MNDCWRTIEKYSGYEVSDTGKIRNKKTLRLLKPNISRGYLLTCLCKDGKCSKFSVHRLVARAFIPNPESKRCVNHKDFNRRNNGVNNLEWCTDQENIQYSIRNGRYPDRKNCPEKWVSISQYDRNGNLLDNFESITSASIALGLGKSAIVNNLTGRSKSSGGYVWKYNYC